VDKQKVRYSVDMSVTYQPKKRKRARTHGFLKRKSTPGGKKTLLRRARKGRARLAV
jgi:large subunit ribosomal protein L34